MRIPVLGALMLCAACLPYEPYWWVQDVQLVGLRLSVVEPGGYSTLVHVPEGQTRATALPLDTVELEWLVATAPGVELAPPIWLVCPSWGCPGRMELEDCPSPLPVSRDRVCRLGEGHRLRVSLAGAYTISRQDPLFGLRLLIVGSRSPDVSPEACLERRDAYPPTDMQDCLFASRLSTYGPPHFDLPFDLPNTPPELLAEAADMHPDITGFRVTRFGRSGPVEVFVAAGDSLAVAAGERIVVDPVLVADAAQTYHIIVPNSGAENGLGRDDLVEESEYLSFDARITALVDQFEAPELGSMQQRISFVVPEHPEPAILYVDVRDGRMGRGFASLRFDIDEP